MTLPPEDQLKTLWKGQETETKPMSVEAMRTRAEVYVQRTRRRYVASVALCLLIAIVFAGYAVWLSHNWVMRVGWGICTLGAGWLVLRLRDRWPTDLPAAGASAGALVDFHRAQIIRQQLRLRNLIVTAGPLLLGVSIALVGLAIEADRISSLAPIGGLFAIWGVAFWLIERRRARKLQRQLDELDAPGGG